MKTRFVSPHRQRLKSFLQSRLRAPRRNRWAKKIQLIYAHFDPPVIFPVTGRSGHIPGPAHGPVVTGSRETVLSSERTSVWLKPAERPIKICSETCIA